MKKLLVFLLLSIFLYNQAGYLIAFKIEQIEARKEIKRRIKNSVPQNELTIIRIGDHNRHEMQWVEDGREFMFNNSLFDVVRVETQGDELVYHCINDTQEKELFAELEEHVSKQMDANGIDNEHAEKSMVKDYFIEEILTPAYDNSVTIHFLITSEAPVSSFTKNPVPPPKQA